MSVFRSEEWQKIAEWLQKESERILKKILVRNSELNEKKYSERDMMIIQREIIENILKKPEKMLNTFSLFSSEYDK